jgi:hypothetical protein
MGDGATAGSDHRHFLPMCRGAADRRIDDTMASGRLSPDNGLIAPLEHAITTMSGKQLGKALMGGIGFGNDQESRSILVEPVDNAGPADTANA